MLESFAKASPFPVRIYRNPERLGYADNFMKAASLCEGELIAFSDQDDVWADGRLALCLPFFDDQEVMLSVHSAVVVDEELRPLGFNSPDITMTQAIFDSLSNYPFPGFAIIVRNSTPGLFDSPRPQELNVSRPMSHDTWVSILARSFGKVAFIKEPLVLYRRHHTTTTTVVNHSTLDRINLSRISSEESYIKIADWTSSIAASLSKIVIHQQGQELLRHKAVKYYQRKQASLRQRARLYTRGQSLLRRLSIFLQMLSNGYYLSQQSGNLGVKSMIKDAASIGIASLRR
jgi:glycosyltransferase involved in cell wall biosynthesis